MKHFINLLILFFFVSCVPQSRYDKLLSENELLKQQLDECENGEQRLIGRIEKDYQEENYTSVKSNIKILFEKHPHSNKVTDYKKLIEVIEEKENVLRLKKEEEDKEQKRLENLNNTGIWGLNYFVDDFGDKTNQAYITTQSSIYGTFSNSATQDTRLRVALLISNPWDIKKDGLNIAIQLFEYAGDNPVKNGGAYDIFIEDAIGERHKLRASNDSDDRMRLSAYSFKGEETDNKKMQKILLKGGSIRFVIKEDTKYGTSSEYKFTIENADFYENAYNKLLELEKNK